MAIARKDPYTQVHELERYCKAEYEEALVQGDRRRANEIYDYFHKRKAEIEMSENVYASVFGTSAGQLGIANNSSGGAISSLAISASDTLSRQYQHALLNQQIYGSSMGNPLSVASGTYTAQSEPETAVEFGVLYMHGKELPADWAGAKITSFTRTVDNKRWCVRFSSKWDKSLDICTFFDTEDVTGKEVTAMAETYMEALNQRRAG